ncbi:MAG: YceI family protein [Pedobacter sp.]|jgi:polyisoprenoid-binding protein YceI
MKKTVLIALVALFSQIAVQAQTTWKSDKAHSKLTFSVVHLGISDVQGLFKDFDVTISASKADFSDGVFELTADVKSIDTEVEMRDNHLKSPDFFDAEKFGKITFKSASIKPAGKNKYTLKGDLTIHGITKPVSMNLLYRGTVVNPMNKANVAGFQLTGILKRSDFNIGPNFKAPMISDEVVIKADGEFSTK